ncbi:MAG: hypothetical protein V8S36_08420 [Lachnospiraceae bacterium]
MKKKLVVKTLALLLTGVMVMEIPMQSYAAEAAAVTQEASTDGAAVTEETETSTDTETSADTEAPADTETPADSEHRQIQRR